MIDSNILLNNPLVKEGYYFAKVVSIDSEPADYFFPKLLIRLVLHPMYSLSKGSVFCAILNPGDRSFYHYKNFFNTFMLGVPTDDLEKAVGRWGSIEICTAEYGDVGYSIVRFCYQPLPVRMESWRIGRDERGM